MTHAGNLKVELHKFYMRLVASQLGFTNSRRIVADSTKTFPCFGADIAPATPLPLGVAAARKTELREARPPRIAFPGYRTDCQAASALLECVCSQWIAFFS